MPNKNDSIVIANFHSRFLCQMTWIAVKMMHLR